MAARVVLIVDDDIGILETMHDILVLHGYQVLIAQTGAEAGEIARSNTPIDLVLLDLALPGMDGAAIRDEIAAARQGVPIVIVTAFSFMTDLLQQHGIPIIMKPVDMDSLLNVIAKLTAHAERREPYEG